jgi:hypothetical protein
METLTRGRRPVRLYRDFSSRRVNSVIFSLHLAALLV